MRAGIVCAFILISPLFICCSSFEWHFKDGNAVITNYKGESSDVVIPGKIQGRPVTEIGEGAFRGCGLTSVVIPQSVSFIGESAFSGQTILAPDRTRLFVDVVNAGNLETAAVLYTAVDPVFTAKDSLGREYSLEFYIYDHTAIYLSAEQITERSLHQTGSEGTRLINGGQTEVRYSPNAFYVFNAYGENYSEDLILQTTEGASFNLNEIINEAREQHYSKSGREKPNDFNPGWHIARIFGKVLYAYNRVYWDEAKNEYALVDISAGKPSVYILETDNLKIGSMTALYEPHTWISLLDDAMDFVIDSEKAYLIRNSGEVLQFAVREHSLQFEKTVSWRDCIIPGWNGGERVFVNGETVEVRNGTLTYK